MSIIDVPSIEPRYTVALITLSDAGAAGERTDMSGDLLHAACLELGLQVQSRDLYPDDRERLADRLMELSERVDLVLTTGGTGLGPRDFTPEATAAVVEKRIPGIEEALHMAGREEVPTSILSRAVAGVRGQCLIINLPGSPGGVRDGMTVLAPVLKHALGVLQGRVRDCQG